MYSRAIVDLSTTFKVKEEYLESLLLDLQGTEGFGLAAVLVRPKSIGELKLKDNNPNSPPIINPRYLQHPNDVQALIEGK